MRHLTLALVATLLVPAAARFVTLDLNRPITALDVAAFSTWWAVLSARAA